MNAGVRSAATKIYFCGSIRAGRQDVDLYGTLCQMLSRHGTVLTPFVADKAITVTGRFGHQKRLDFCYYATFFCIHTSTTDVLPLLTRFMQRSNNPQKFSQKRSTQPVERTKETKVACHLGRRSFITYVISL